MKIELNPTTKPILVLVNQASQATPQDTIWTQCKAIIAQFLANQTPITLVASLPSTNDPQLTAWIRQGSIGHISRTPNFDSDARGSYAIVFLLFADGPSNEVCELMVGRFRRVCESLHQNALVCAPQLRPTVSDMHVPSLPVIQRRITSPAPVEPLLSQTTKTSNKGVLYLVGAGLGSADYLTVKAMQVLMHDSDVIISDRLVSPALLGLLPPSKLKFSRKTRGKSNEAQQEIHGWIVDALQRGQTVARLKNGDPFLFGRGGEECLIASSLGFPVRVVPGVSSCIGALSVVGIPATHRGVSDTLVVSTGRLQDGTAPEYPTFNPNTTYVFLMAMGSIERLVSSLHGLRYPSDLPCAVIERATYDDQRVMYGQLDSIGDVVRASGVSQHATLVMGHVVHVLEPGRIQQGDTNDDDCGGCSADTTLCDSSSE